MTNNDLEIRARAIFLDLLEQGPAEKIGALIDAACGDDVALSERLCMPCGVPNATPAFF